MTNSVVEYNWRIPTIRNQALRASSISEKRRSLPKVIILETSKKND